MQVEICTESKNLMSATLTLCHKINVKTKDKKLTMTNKPVSNNLSRKQKPHARGWELAIVPMN